MKKYNTLHIATIIYLFFLFNISFLYLSGNRQIAYILFMFSLFLFSVLIVTLSIYSLDAHHSPLLCVIGCMHGTSISFMTLTLPFTWYDWHLPSNNYLIVSPQFIQSIVIFIFLFCISTILVFRVFNGHLSLKKLCYNYIAFVLIIFSIHIIISYTFTSHIQVPHAYFSIFLTIVLAFAFIMITLTTYICYKYRSSISKNHASTLTYLTLLGSSIIFSFILSFIIPVLLYMVIQLTSFYFFFKIIMSDSILQYSQSLIQKLELHSTNNKLMNAYMTHLSEEQEAMEKQSSHNKEQRDKLQQAIELEKFKVEFFCTISHELKTPVNIIYSATQLQNNFIKSQDYDKIPSYNIMIEQNCMRLLKLLNNFLDINRLESHYFSTSFRTLNIVTLTEGILDSISPYTERKNIHSLFDTCEEEIYCTVDPDLMERILLNLLSNAIKYGHENGHIWVNITLDSGYVCIHIADDGVGIPPESKQLIFERFTRIENGLIRKAEGAGIGLSLVKSFVELNKGSIDVESELGKGTEFIIKFPLETDPILLQDLDYNYIARCDKVDIELSDL